MSADQRLAPDSITASPRLPATALKSVLPLRPVAALLPGLAAAAGIALVATLLGSRLPVVGAPVLAIVIGIAVVCIRTPPARLRPGVAFAGRRVLQASIVILGLGMSLQQVLTTGERSLPVLLGTLLAALAMAWLVGRALGLRADLTTLIGVGTAICGASAIAATDAVIGAEAADVSYAIATIFTFNVIAVLTYPTIGHLLGLSQQAFGLWAGTAINDTSSVVAASSVYGHAAASFGVVVKLTRTLAIIPICLFLAGWRLHRSRMAATGLGASEGAGRGAFDLRRVVPLFIVGFVVAVAVNTLGLVPSGWHPGLSELATWMITAALAAIGLSANPSQIRRAGVRPILLGATLWATVGLVSIGLQFWTGSI